MKRGYAALFGERLKSLSQFEFILRCKQREFKFKLGEPCGVNETSLERDKRRRERYMRPEASNS